MPDRIFKILSLSPPRPGRGPRWRFVMKNLVCDMTRWRHHNEWKYQETPEQNFKHWRAYLRIRSPENTNERERRYLRTNCWNWISGDFLFFPPLVFWIQNFVFFCQIFWDNHYVCFMNNFYVFFYLWKLVFSIPWMKLMGKSLK